MYYTKQERRINKTARQVFEYNAKGVRAMYVMYYKGIVKELGNRLNDVNNNWKEEVEIFNNKLHENPKLGISLKKIKEYNKCTDIYNTLHKCKNNSKNYKIGYQKIVCF